MVSVIHVAGCERSGTNYIQWLLRENFQEMIVLTTYKHYAPKSIFTMLDWGHGSQKEKIVASPRIRAEVNRFVEETSLIRTVYLPPLAFVSKEFTEPKLREKSPDVEHYVREAIENGTMKFIVNIKNPYGWHLSYSSRWARYKFGECIGHWNDLYESWMEFEKNYPNSTMFIKHEDALKDYKGTLLNMFNKFNLVKADDIWVAPTSRLSSMAIEQANTKFTRKNYFEKELYKDSLKKTQRLALDKCREVLSQDLMQRFNYEVL